MSAGQAQRRTKITDEELEAEYQALLHTAAEEEDDGISGTPEGEYYWNLLARIEVEVERRRYEEEKEERQRLRNP